MRSFRSLVVIFATATLASCASFDAGPELTAAQVIELSQAGESPASIVERLRRSGTVLWLSATDIVKLREAGVSPEVLDHLQAAQIAETRRQSQFDQLLYGPEMSPFSRCGGLAAAGGRFNGYFAPYCF